MILIITICGNNKIENLTNVRRYQLWCVQISNLEQITNIRNFQHGKVTTNWLINKSKIFWFCMPFSFFHTVSFTYQMRMTTRISKLRTVKCVNQKLSVWGTRTTFVLVDAKMIQSSHYFSRLSTLLVFSIFSSRNKSSICHEALITNIIFVIYDLLLWNGLWIPK